MKNFFTASNIAKLGIFSALAVILYFLNFPLPFFPPFLEIHLSDLPALICGFTLGPIGGVLTVVIKILIKLPFSATSFVGECADLILGIFFVLPASIIYKRAKTKKSAISGIIIGSLCSITASIFANWLVIVPFYTHETLGFTTMETLVKVCSGIMPFINESNFYPCYLFLSVLPFNALRCIVVSLITIFVYKRISNLLKRF
jgi:riboflavin transporter FmnP